MKCDIAVKIIKAAFLHNSFGVVIERFSFQQIIEDNICINQQYHIFPPLLALILHRL